VLEGFITDITARDRNERALRTVSATQRAVLQRVTDGVLLVDPAAAEILETNAAAADLTGYSEGELVGIDPTTLFAPAETTVAELAGPETVDRDLSIATPDGSTRTLLARGCTLSFEDHRRLVLVLSPIK
jgi:PAS domain S-box-containing protein